MKSLRHEIRYDGASIDQVHAMLQDTAFREKVCDYQRCVRHDVTIDVRGETMTVRIDFAHGSSRVPSFARKFVGDEIAILQEESWTSPTEAALTVTIPGKPGEMVGTIGIEEFDWGIVETIAADVVVKIPLVGGKIEGLIADLLLKALKAENKVGIEWLAGQ